MMMDVEGLRAETPACAKGLVHFNNAGASLMPVPVSEAVAGHLRLEVERGGYEAAELAADRVSMTYDAAAQLIGGHRDEIALVSNATAAWLAAFHAFDWQPGDEVLTASSEYNSNMIALRHAARRHGIRPVIVPDEESGAIDTVALEEMITPRTRLICVSHMPTNDGLVNPVAEVGRVAARHDIPFLLDACQSVGQYPIDVGEIGCSMLSATGRKYLRGPRGTGFLWVRRDWIDRLSPYVLDIRSAEWCGVDTYRMAPDATRFELWESNVAAQIGLGAACRYSAELGVDRIWARVRDLSRKMRRDLSSLQGVVVRDRGAEQSGIVTFTVARLCARDVVERLRTLDAINTSVSATQLTRVDLVAEGVTELVRASVHAYNTEAEIEKLVLSVEEARLSGAGSSRTLQ